MGFKIGDRVRVNLPGSAEDGAYGEVVKNPYVGESGGFIGAFLTDGPCAGLHGLYMNDELAPAIAPRGPKPLTLTGGKARFTVTAGRTMRKPTSHWSNHVWLLRAPGRNP